MTIMQNIVTSPNAGVSTNIEPNEIRLVGLNSFSYHSVRGGSDRAGRKGEFYPRAFLGLPKIKFCEESFSLGG